ESPRRLGDADERRAQVALDVDPERFERRDVEHPGALRGVGGGRREQPIERPQERGERLTGARGGDDERVPPRGDRLPRPRLRGGRCGERAGEPLPRGRGEALERGIHPPIFTPTPDLRLVARLEPRHTGGGNASRRGVVTPAVGCRMRGGAGGGGAPGLSGGRGGSRPRRAASPRSPSGRAPGRPPPSAWYAAAATPRRGARARGR